MAQAAEKMGLKPGSEQVAMGGVTPIQVGPAEDIARRHTFYEGFNSSQAAQNPFLRHSAPWFDWEEGHDHRWGSKG